MDSIFNVSVNVLNEIDFDLISNIEEKLKNSLSISNDEINYFLSYLCFKVRELLSLKKSKNILDNKFTNQCDSAQSMIYNYLNSLGVESIPVNTNEVIDSNVIGHSFIIACILDNYYLIDPTYNQFFELEKCLSSNKIVINGTVVKCPDPGYFVNDYSLENKEVIINLLRSGFMKIDYDNLRLYGDSLYKTKTGVSDANMGSEFMFGSTYLKAFLKSKATLSLSSDELMERGLLISPINTKNYIKKV